MKKLRKFSSKTLAVLLSFLIVVSVIPMHAFATEVIDYMTTGEVEIESKPELVIKEEIVEERSANSKTYLLEDGTYCDIIFSNNIHQYIDGSWEDIGTEISYNDEAITIDDVSSQITSQLSSQVQTYSTNIGDGTVISDPNNKIKLVINEIKLDEESNTEITLDCGSAFLNDESYAVIDFDMTSNKNYEKAEVTINATLSMNYYSDNDESVVTVLPFNLDLTDNSITFDDVLSEYFSNPTLDFKSLSSEGEEDWDITSQYIKFENGTSQSNSLLVVPDYSNEIIISAAYLQRQYRLVDDNDTGFSYHTINMGRAGNVYINDFTNAAYLERSELGISGNILPVTISTFIAGHTEYNSYGSGGRINYQSKISYSSSTFTWNMFNGSSIRFQKSTNNETNTDGLEKWNEISVNPQGYTLWVQKDLEGNYVYSSFYITDEEDYKYTFNSDGYVTSIVNSENENIEIEYVNNRINSITDGVGRVYSFDYDWYNNVRGISKISINTLNENDELIPIELPAEYRNEAGNLVPVEMSISYDYQTINGNIYLSKAIYSDGKTVEYSYDSLGRLVTIKNIDNSLLELNYSVPESIASQNKNPTYLGKIESYTKKVLDINNNYVIDFKVEIDSNNTYRRIFKQSNNENEVIFTETIQFNRNLDVLYFEDSADNTFYADYNNSHELLSLVIPENNANVLEDKNWDMNPLSNNSSIPKTWKLYNISRQPSANQSEMVLHEGTTNDYYLQINNEKSTTRAVYQNLDIDGHAGEKYIISAWGLGYSTIPKEDRFWGIKISAENANNELVQIHTMSFDTSLYGVEQTRTTAFSLPFDTTSLKIELISQNQLGSVAFDKIRLNKADYAYVANVDDVETIDNCMCTDCEYVNCTCTCENPESCTCVSCDIKTTIDNVDNVKTITSTNGIKEIVSTYEYTANNNYLSQYIDENGVSSSYEYSLTNGLLLSETFADDAEITYGYDAIGALTSVSQTVTNVLTNNQVTMNTIYSYENDRISSITHNGFTYNYEYDIYGNLKSFSLNNSPLINYSYNNDYYKNLGSIEYANGSTTIYSYDNKGNIKEISYDGGNTYAYTYEYDVYNKLVSYTNYMNGTKTSYNKTIEGKDYEVVVQSLDENGIVIYGIENGTNFSYVETVFDRSYTILNSTEYDAVAGNVITTQTTPITIFNGNGTAINTSISDSLDRRIEESLKFTCDSLEVENASITVKNEYTYVNKDATKTTRQVDTFKVNLIIEYDETDSNGNKNRVINSEEQLNLKYKYDDSGRINTIYEYRSAGYYPIAYYQYDEAGQLTVEYNGFLNQVWSYTYDAGGNITSKNLHENYTHNGNIDNLELLELGVPSSTITYRYQNTCKDLLTSYNGHAIWYDEIGNPLNYYGSTINGEEVDIDLEWTGRLLTAAESKDGKNRYEYTYDASGLRTSKTILQKETFTATTTDASGNTTVQEVTDFIPSAKIEYIWSDGTIVAYKTSTFEPTKDANGKYTLNNSNVVLEENNSIVIRPLYNEYNEPLGVNCYTTSEDEKLSETFYFVKDAQGNVRSIYSLENDYTIGLNYDALGNISLDISGAPITNIQNSIINAEGEIAQIIATILGNVVIASIIGITFTASPYAYRGYIFDIETGLYYCQSRYYSPSWGKFITADDPSILEMTIGNVCGANLFAYCNNDPINFTDPIGFFATSWIVSVVDVAIIVIPAIYSINQTLKKGKVVASIFSKISDELAEIVAEVLLKHVKSKTAINVGLTVAKNIGKLVNYFSKISIGFLVEYIVDCLDGNRNHDLNTKANLKFRIIL